MTTIKRTGVASVALLMMAGQSWAGDTCARPDDATALKAASLQQELMVAALTCHDITQYNHFVISYRTELQHSDQALQSYFTRANARTGTADYHAYKTRLANESSLDSVHDPLYCQRAKAEFDDALESDKTSLADVVSRRDMPGFEACDEEAAAVGSYAVEGYTRTASRRNRP